MEAAADPRVALQTDVRAGVSSSRTAQSSVRARRLVYAGTAVYVAVFVVAAVVAYLAYDVARLDLGDMVQAIWSTAHGHFLEATNESGRQASRLGGHVDPFLALLVPLWWVWPSPLMLVVLQVVAVAAGALPVYWLARKHFRSDVAPACFAFAYLLYPATQANAIGVGDSFHSVSIAIPLILFAIWFLDEERLVLFAVFALLAASTKEEIAASVGCLGLWYAVRRKRWGVGLSIFGLGMAVSLVNFLVIIPHFSPSGANPFAERYQRVGGSPTGILHTAVADPVAIVHVIATWHKLFYLLLLLAPFLGLWLLEPLLFLGAIPDLVINLLSSKPEQTQLYWQYTAGIVPFVLAASIIGASKLRRNADRLALGALAAVLFITLANPGLTPIYSIAVLDLGHVLPSDPTHAARSHALGLIPRGVPVSSSNKLGGLLSDRRFIYSFPTRKNAEWVIVDARDGPLTGQQWYRHEIAAIGASPAWRVVYRSHGIEVLHRQSAG
jgi:uncharacterized membrane protein